MPTDAERLAKAAHIDESADYFESEWGWSDTASNLRAFADDVREWVGVIDPHAYFDALVTRPDCLFSLSLRDQAQLLQYRNSQSLPPSVTYDYANDPDPRKQDAAKMVIGLPSNSLVNQVRFPLPESRDAPLTVTWDAWYGAEFLYPQHGILTTKTFQFATSQAANPLTGAGNLFSVEVQNRWAIAAAIPSIQPAASLTGIRLYGGASRGPGVVMGPKVKIPGHTTTGYGSETLGPMAADFWVVPETWTRYWLRLVPWVDPSTGIKWWQCSLWMADETRDPTLIYDALAIRPVNNFNEPQDWWYKFWIEFNTSSSAASTEWVGRTWPLVAYVRNWAACQTDTLPLEKPV